MWVVERCPLVEKTYHVVFMPPHWKCAKSNLQHLAVTRTSTGTSSHFARFRTANWNLYTRTQIPADPMVAVFCLRNRGGCYEQGALRCQLGWPWQPQGGMSSKTNGHFGYCWFSVKQTFLVVVVWMHILKRDPSLTTLTVIESRGALNKGVIQCTWEAQLCLCPCFLHTPSAQKTANLVFPFMIPFAVVFVPLGLLLAVAVWRSSQQPSLGTVPPGHTRRWRRAEAA